MLNILIVDDNLGDQILLKETIKRTGIDCQVTAVSDVDECFKIVKEVKPDLFMLDVMLPKMNGYDLCYTLKYDLRFKETPVIMFTVLGEEIDPRIGKLMGIYYLHKPCRHQDLVATINKIFKMDLK